MMDTAVGILPREVYQRGNSRKVAVTLLGQRFCHFGLGLSPEIKCFVPTSSSVEGKRMPRGKSLGGKTLKRPIDHYEHKDRRGTDVFKALALGATAVGFDRPQAWGLAAFGQSGVEAVLTILRRELEQIMRQAGTPSIRSITRLFITH